MLEYVRLTESKNGSGNGFITPRSYSIHPRVDVLNQWAVVNAILDRVHPRWRDEHKERDTYEFGQQRDAVIHAISMIEQADDMRAHMDSLAPMLSADHLHPWVWEPARALWRDGHYRAAIQTAGIGLDAELQDLARRRDVTGTRLVGQALSNDPPEPGKPRLRVPDQGNDETTRSAQNGLRDLGTAAMMLVRNVATHTLDDLSEHDALERMAVLSLFARQVNECELVEAQ